METSRSGLEHFRGWLLLLRHAVCLLSKPGFLQFFFSGSDCWRTEVPRITDPPCLDLARIVGDMTNDYSPQATLTPSTMIWRAAKGRWSSPATSTCIIIREPNDVWYLASRGLTHLERSRKCSLLATLDKQPRLTSIRCTLHRVNFVKLALVFELLWFRRGFEVGRVFAHGAGWAKSLKDDVSGIVIVSSQASSRRLVAWQPLILVAARARFLRSVTESWTVATMLEMKREVS